MPFGLKQVFNEFTGSKFLAYMLERNPIFAMTGSAQQRVIQRFSFGRGNLGRLARWRCVCGIRFQ